ncbi:MAG: hypothetical protein ACJAS1_003772 [Oleiphilaceae bacterium]|jgi:hypothetical protein
MVNALVYSSILCLIGLLSYMLYRIKTLYITSYPERATHATSILNHIFEKDIQVKDEYESKMECLKQAQIFTGVQMLNIKRSYGDLNQENMAWLREAISLYLIGAVDFIGKQARCDTSTRKELITLVLKSNLKLSKDISNQYFSEALYRKFSSQSDLMIRSGAKAAKSWVTNQKVPNDLTLSCQLDDWGVFA